MRAGSGLVLAAAGVAAVLAAGSTVAVAALGGAFDGRRTWTACGVPALAGSVVDVTLTDMGMGRRMMGVRAGLMRVLAAPASVRAGVVSFRVVNTGMLRHELLVLPLAAGQGVGTRPVGAGGQVSEEGALGEASRDCAEGTGEGIRPGASGWVTVHLSTGRYELVCNRADHYSAGMFTELDVM